tara:strand:+ start:2672 stop:4711 length:2040 start_codon:yes stop_codon:yes gene_type:complete
MATQSHNNYTITNVTYSVAGGSNVYTSHPTAVLTITPDVGYSVTAEDFSWANTTLANVNTVVFTQDGANVICTVTFDNPFTMPTSNTTLSLCINGAAIRQRLSLRGYYQATGSNTNMSIVQDCPVPQEISYEVAGVEGYQVLVIEKTYTASSGYYFNGSFNISYTGDEMVVENYNCIETETLDSSGRLTSINIKFYYTFPNNNVINDKITVEVPVTKQIKVVPVKITSYSLFDNTSVASSGAIRTVRIFGAPTATFTLASNNGSILSFDTYDANDVLLSYATTPTLTIPANGYFDITISIPAVSSNATYCFTIAGGNLISPFPQINPFCLYQYVRTILTFSASGTNLVVSNVLPSQTGFIKTGTAMSQPASGSSSYNNDMEITVTGNSGQALSLANNFDEESWSNSYDIGKTVQATVSNSNIITVDNTTDLLVGSELFAIPNITNTVRKITNISGNNVTLDGAAFSISSLTNLPTFVFSNRKKSDLDLVSSATIDQTGLTATVNTSSQIYRYGDGNVAFNLNLLDLITVGSANACGKYTVSAGTSGGSFIYFDCITKSKRQIILNKGDVSFAICALASPAPSGSGTVTVVNNNTVCAKTASTQLDCIEWSIVYNPSNPRAKSVTVTYIDCVTLEEETLNVGIGATPTTQCATRQVPISSDPGDGGATITQTWNGSNPCT